MRDYLLLMYIVTSKPKRMSLYSGVSHFIVIAPQKWLMVKRLKFLGLFPAQDYAVCVPRFAKMSKKLKIHFIFNSLYAPYMSHGP